MRKFIKFILKVVVCITILVFCMPFFVAGFLYEEMKGNFVTGMIASSEGAKVFDDWLNND